MNDPKCHAAKSSRSLCERLADDLPDIKCPCGRSDVVRQLLVRAWSEGWREGYASPDLPVEPGEHAEAEFMNPYRIEGVDK